MNDVYQKDGVIHLSQALTTESLDLAHAAYQWSLSHPGPGASDIPSKTPGTFYQDLANPDAFATYDTPVSYTHLTLPTIYSV